MHRVLAVALTAALGYASPILAREGGGHHDQHHGASAVAGHGNAGGMASEHMSPHGMENSNAQWSTGAARGQDHFGSRNQDGQMHRHEAGHGDHPGKDKHQGHHDHGGNKGNKDKGDKGHKTHKGKGQ